ETAEDGIAALKVLSEITPDLVVLDLMLPKFSGRDVFDYMRADPQFRNIPVIIFSNAPKSDWPKDVESSPTRALPKSEANFAALMELIKEMTAAAANGSVAIPAPVAPPQAPAAPDAEPGLKMPGNSNGNGAEPVADQFDFTRTADQFLEYAIAEMPAVREHCLAFIKAPSTDAGRENLSGLRKRLSVLHAGAQKTGCSRLSLLASAWEALLSEIERKPSVISPSILQTLAQAADCLRILLTNTTVNCMDPLPKARVLSVDDDEICNDVAVTALQSADLAADSTIDATVALSMLEQNDYDLVLLDINMPGLTGFELCEKLRALPHHAKTPVIFVTAFNNFENRKQSVLSGGGDLIAKPVAGLELALKVTIHLLKAPPRLVNAPASANGQPPHTDLVWKEPKAIISHDTEMFLRGITTGNSTPNLVAPTTETRTTDPEKPDAELPVPAAEVTNNSEPVREEALEPAAALIPAGALAELAMESAETKIVVENKAPSPTPSIPVPAATPVAPIPAPLPPPIAAAAPVTPVAPLPSSEEAPEPASKGSDKKNKTLENVAAKQPSSDKGQVVPNQPPKTNEPPPPAKSGSSKERQSMTKENNPQFDTLVLDVAHIIFGDNAPDINVRLVR